MGFPSLADLLEAARVVSIPLRTRFRGVTAREAMLFEAPRGWTEFSPFLEYGAAEASAWLAAAVEYGWGAGASGASVAPDASEASFAACGSNNDCASSTAGATRIPVNATVPAVTPDEVAPVLARFGRVHTVKVKVAEPGQSIADDIARLKAVREFVGDEAKLRIDANGAWTLPEAIAALDKLKHFDLDYAEQPVASAADLARLRAHQQEHENPVKIAADESIRKASDPLEVARLGAADVIVVKAQPLGGISRALSIIEAAGLPAVVSSALETSVGLSMGAHLAASLPPHLAYGAHGLGTAALLAGDVTDTPITPKNGFIDVRRPEVSDTLLTRYDAAPDRHEHWQTRLKAAYAHLQNSAKQA